LQEIPMPQKHLSANSFPLYERQFFLPAEIYRPKGFPQQGLARNLGTGAVSKLPRRLYMGLAL
jgi:hypothetical protein